MAHHRPCPRRQLLLEEYLLPRLTIDKTADRTELPALGDVVTYTVTVTNPGPGAYTDTAPATFTDNLAAVLDDATLVPGSISASAGTVTVTGTELVWSGPISAGGAVTVSYQVAYNGAGNQILANRVCVPASAAAPGANPCDDVQIPAALPTMWKEVSASQTPADDGQRPEQPAAGSRDTRVPRSQRG